MLFIASFVYDPFESHFSLVLTVDCKCNLASWIIGVA
jgi:hypothetical protein